MGVKYQRVLIKLSGEALAGGNGTGFDHDMLDRVTGEIMALLKLDIEVAIVVGGGNFWRGRAGGAAKMDAVTADHMGMLATVINALALQDALERKGVDTRVQTAIEMRQFAEPYIRRKAMHHLEEKRVVIFACGTGNPHFTTDTAAALRATEIVADAILLAKNVDGVYSSDPKKDPSAVKYDRISYIDVINKDLKVMDNTAITICMNSHMPIVVFGLDDPHNIVRAASGETIGTLVVAEA